MSKPTVDEIASLYVISELQDVLKEMKHSHELLQKRVKTLEDTVSRIQEGLIK